MHESPTAVESALPVAPTLFTIGHSTRELDAFLALLEQHRIECLVDVRRFPGSRRLPHYGSDALARSLAAAGIAYRHAPDLGGRRKPMRDSPNAYWRNDSFRAYADHMASPEFQDALALLLADVARARTVILCAEAVPWRCHRNLIADAAVAAGVPVEHILNNARTQSHVINSAACVGADGVLTYPAPESAQAELGL